MFQKYSINNYSDIYCITNVVNNKKYIGKAVNVKKRWKSDHKRLLNSNNHYNQHLQNSWNKYGESNFELSILFDEVPINIVDEYEKFYIDFYSTSNPLFGFNKTLGGEGGLRTEESKEKMSQTQKVFQNLPEVRKKNSERNSGNGNAMFGKNVLDVWTEKYGQETAEKMWEEKYKDYPRIFGKENNPMFGKSVYSVWVKKYGAKIADKIHEDFIKKQKDIFVKEPERRLKKSKEKILFHQKNPKFTCRDCFQIFDNFGAVGTHKRYCLGRKK